MLHFHMDHAVVLCAKNSFNLHFSIEFFFFVSSHVNIIDKQEENKHDITYC